MLALTLTGPIRPSENGTLLDLPEALKQPAHVVLTLLLPQHAHEQLPVFWREEKNRRRRKGGAGHGWCCTPEALPTPAPHTRMLRHEIHNYSAEHSSAGNRNRFKGCTGIGGTQTVMLVLMCVMCVCVCVYEEFRGRV